MIRKERVAQLITRSQASDWLGIVSSGLCLVHCLLMPAVLLLQLRFTAHQNPHWHDLDYAFLAISFFACYASTRRCTSRHLVMLLWSFFCLLALSVLLHNVSEFLDYTAYLASAGLLVCHFLNIRYCRKCHPIAS